jgi:transcription termination factor Rho
VTASAANTPRDRTGQKPKPKTVKSMEVASGDATRQAQRESNRLKRAARRRAARQRHQQQKLLKPQQTLQKQQHSKAKPKPKPKAQRQNGKGRGRGQQKKKKQKQQQLLPRQQPRQPLARLDSDVMTAFSSLGL